MNLETYKIKLRHFALCFLHILLLILFRSYSDLPYVGLYKMLSPMLLLRHIETINYILLRDRANFMDPRQVQEKFCFSTLEKGTDIQGWETNTSPTTESKCLTFEQVDFKLQIFNTR